MAGGITIKWLHIRPAVVKRTGWQHLDNKVADSNLASFLLVMFLWLKMMHALISLIKGHKRFKKCVFGQDIYPVWGLRLDTSIYKSPSSESISLRSHNCANNNSNNESNDSNGLFPVRFPTWYIPPTCFVTTQHYLNKVWISPNLYRFTS